MASELDAKLVDLCTPENIGTEFHHYKLIKTDLMDEEPNVRMKMGCDGVTFEAFELELDRNARNMSSRLLKNRYFFAPFRELIVSKDFTLRLRTAIRKDKTRVLSIACIRDVVVQRILHQVVTPFLEKTFRKTPELDRASFAYRTGKSAPAAARQTFAYIQAGYLYILDADIKKFFDEIPHNNLLNLIDRTLDSNPLVTSLLRRFIRADRVEWDWYRGNENKFYTRRPKRTPRKQGIPQGGVLSGPIANLYLHPFDEWVLEELGRSYDLKYVRYADDFVIMTRTPEVRDSLLPLVRTKLSDMGLHLHDDPKKTKLLDLTHPGESLEFVGFNLSPTGTRVKRANITKFKRRFHDKLWAKIDWTGEPSPAFALMFIVQKKLQFKVLGNWTEGVEECLACGKPVAFRSWVSFFATVTDVQQLRSLDRWIRKEVHAYFHSVFGVRVSAKDLEAAGLERLERVYYYVRNHIEEWDLCTCKRWESTEAHLTALADIRSPLSDLFEDTST